MGGSANIGWNRRTHLVNRPSRRRRQGLQIGRLTTPSTWAAAVAISHRRRRGKEWTFPASVAHSRRLPVTFESISTMGRDWTWNRDAQIVRITINIIERATIRWNTLTPPEGRRDSIPAKTFFLAKSRKN